MIEAIADRGAFLDRPTRRWMVRRWRAELDRDAEQVARLDVAPERARLPAQWREVVEGAGEVLRGWNEHGKEAHDRVLAALVEGFDRVDWEMRSAEEHPRHTPIARAFQRAGEVSPLEFLNLAPVLLERVNREVPGGGYVLRALQNAITGMGRAEDELSAQVVKNLVLERWSQSLEARVVEWERTTLQRGLARIAEDLRRKQEAVASLRNQLGLELAYAGFGLDWSEGLFHAGAWAALDSYAAMVDQNTSLRRLAEQLGRYEGDRGAVQLETGALTRADPRRRLLRAGRSEVRGIHLGDELDRLTAGDLALLADPDTEMVFYLRFLEKRLLTYEMEGREVYSPRASAERAREVARPREKGPIILCLDTSGSMAGEPELVAKTLCLALLRVALREHRPCWAISFSGSNDLHEQELTALPASLPALLRFLASSFRGGTDPAPALDATLHRLETTTYRRADVLWVSDGIFAVPEASLSRVAAVKAGHDARFHVLLIGEGSPPPFTDVCWRWSAGSSFASGAVQLVEEVAVRSRAP